MVEFWANTTSKQNVTETQVSEFMALHRSKALHLKEKIPMQLVDSV
jgi:hypothetical protein